MGGTAAEEEDQAEDEETDEGEDFYAGEPEFGFAVVGDGEDVEGEDGEEEQGDPDYEGAGGDIRKVYSEQGSYL